MEESPPKRRRPPAAPRLYDQEAAGDAGFEGADNPASSPNPPAVVAVVVSSGGPELESALTSLRDQDYPNLELLVIAMPPSGGTVPTDLTSRVAGVLPSAYIRQLTTNAGFAAAANEALGAVEGAPFLLICRDRVKFDPHAVRALVEEAFRSNAGLVGPKMVDADRPDVLLEVGLAIDKFGATYSGIEPGEIDQEQHDAVRDVFYVSSAAFLVRADLFTALGGFDPSLGDTGEDLDLCWRTRLAGARVLVVPDARVREPASDVLLSFDDRRAENRNRIRTVLKNYSFGSLLRVLPQALLITLVEAIALLLLRRRAQARALIDGWSWNLRHFGDVRRARAATQSLRAVPDSDIRFLQVTGSARARDFILGRIEHGGRARELVRSSRDMVDATADRLGWTTVVTWVALIGLPLFGARELLTAGIPGVGSMLAWPGVPAMVRELTGSWRFSGLGSAAPHPTAFAVMAVVGSVFLGATAFARTALIVGALPIGVVAAYRLARGRAVTPVAAVAVAVAYGANPVIRNAITNGRFGAVLLFAAAPFLLSRVLAAGERAAIVDDQLDNRDKGDGGPVRRWRAVLPLALVTAALAAISPPIALFAPVAALALIPVAGVTLGWRAGRTAALRSFGIALATTAVVFVLLLPWSLSLVLPGSDPASSGISLRPALDLGAVLRFDTGRAGGGWLGFALVIAAVVGLAIAGGLRLRMAAQGWALMLAGCGIAFVSGQRWSGGPWPSPELALVLAALGVALAVGAGVCAFLEDLPRASFGWRHAASVVGGAGLLVASLGFVGATTNGRYGLASRGWSSTLSWMDARRGEFRVLWMGDPAVLPLDAWTLRDGTGYGLTRNGAGDARVLWPIPASGTSGLVADAVRDAVAGRTDRLGDLLGPMGVRYIALPQRSAPTAPDSRTRRPALEQALAGQLDLRSLPIQRGLVLYENTSWRPIGALVRTSDGGADPKVASLAAESLVAVGRRGWSGASLRTRTTGQLLWSETFDRRWEATVNGRTLKHQRYGGWANRFTIDRPGHVVIRHRGLPLRLGELALEFGVWVVAIGWWWRHRRVGKRVAVAPDVTADHTTTVPEPIATTALSSLDVPFDPEGVTP